MNSFSRSKAGIGIVQVVIVAALIAGLTVVVLKLSSFSNQFSQRNRDSLSFTSLRSQFSELKGSPKKWVDVLRNPPSTPNPILTWNPASCLNTTGGSYPCPTTQGTSAPKDTYITQMKFPDSSIGFAASTELIDLSGQLIAGTESAPVYYDGNGAICTAGPTSPTCRYFAVGYMIRKNNSGNPGDIMFVIKVSQNTSVLGKNDIKMAATYESILVPQTTWEEPPDPVCGAGEFMGRTTTNTKACFSAGQCGAGEAFSGWNASGERICQPLPKPPSTGQCPNNQILVGFENNGSLICR